MGPNLKVIIDPFEGEKLLDNCCKFVGKELKCGPAAIFFDGGGGDAGQIIFFAVLEEYSNAYIPLLKMRKLLVIDDFGDAALEVAL